MPKKKKDKKGKETDLYFETDESLLKILANHNKELSEKDMGRLFKSFILEIVDSNKSRKSFRASENVPAGFSNGPYKKSLKSTFNVDNPDQFKVIEEKGDMHLLSNWFTNNYCWFESNEFVDKAFIVKRDGLSKYPTLYDAIRNCLCHGNFLILQKFEKKYLLFEDHIKESKKITGIGLIQLETLFKLDDAIKHFKPKET